MSSITDIINGHKKTAAPAKSSPQGTTATSITDIINAHKTQNYDKSITSSADLANWYDSSYRLLDNAGRFYDSTASFLGRGDELQDIYAQAKKYSDYTGKNTASVMSAGQNKSKYTGEQTAFLKKNGYSSMSELEKAIEDAQSKGTYDADYGRTYRDDLNKAITGGGSALAYLKAHKSDYDNADELIKSTQEYIGAMKETVAAMEDVKSFFNQWENEDEYKNGLSFGRTLEEMAKATGNYVAGKYKSASAQLSGSKQTDLTMGQSAQAAGKNQQKALEDINAERLERAGEKHETAKKFYNKAASHEELAKWQKNGLGEMLVTAGIQLPEVGMDAALNFAVGTATGIPGAGLINMGIRAFGDASYQAREAGMSWDKAELAGWKSALVEVATEKMFSAVGKFAYGPGYVDGMVEKAITGATKNKGVRAVLKGAAAFAEEGLEEVLADVFNPALDLVFNLRDEDGKLLDEVSAAQVLEDFMVGGIMGLVSTGGQAIISSGVSALNNPKIKKIYGVAAQELVAEGMESAEGTEARRLAEEYQKRLDSGKELTGGQLAKLIEANDEFAREEDKGIISEGVKNRLEELGETTDIQALGAAVVKQLAGEPLTRKELKVIRGSKYGQRVLNEANPENIRSGNYTNEWAQKLNTSAINSNEYGKISQPTEEETDEALQPMTYDEQEEFLRERYADALAKGAMKEDFIGTMMTQLRKGTPLEDMVKRADGYVQKQNSEAQTEKMLRDKYAAAIKDGYYPEDIIDAMMDTVRKGTPVEEVMAQADAMLEEMRNEGNNVTDGSMGRQSGNGTGEQSDGVSGRAAEGEGAQRRTDTGREEARGDDSKKPQREKVSGKELNIPKGTDNKTMSVVKPSGVEARIVKAFMPAAKSIILVKGDIEQKTEDGIVKVTGLETSDGRIWARMDHKMYSGTKLLLHECGHLYIRDDAELRRQMHNAAVEVLSENGAEMLANRYYTIWKGLYPLPEGVTEDTLGDYFENNPEAYAEFLDTYEEEIWCDALAGLDRVNAPGASKLTDALRAVFLEETGIDIDALINGTETAQTVTSEAHGSAAEVEERAQAPPAIKYSYGGETAETANIKTLEEAKQLEKTGEDSETIRRQTGWFKGMDGKWRFEIDDSGMEYDATGNFEGAADKKKANADHKAAWDKLLNEATDEELSLVRAYNRAELDQDTSEAVQISTKIHKTGIAELFDDYINAVHRARMARGSSDGGKLSDYIKHTALFANYPQLRRTNLVFEKMGEGTRGFFSASTNSIHISESLRNAPEETLIHEIQHAIQEAEGFARGASPEFWESVQRSDNPVTSSTYKIKKFKKKIEDIKKIVPADVFKTFEDISKSEDNPGEYDSLYASIPDEYLEAFEDYFMTQWGLEDAEKYNFKRGENDLYRNTAGEIEARDVSARLRYSEEERKNTSPQKANLDTVFAEDSWGASGYGYYSEDDTYEVEGNKAVMSDKRLNNEIDDSRAGNRSDYAQAWVTSINPTEFLNMTLGERNQNRDVFDNMPGDYDSTVNDRDFLPDLKNSRQTPYLNIDLATGEVVGHEGRHRMRALEKAGVTSAEILVRFTDSSGRVIKEINGYGNPAMIIERKTIFNQRGTGQSTEISNIIPLNNAFRGDIFRTYGEGTANNKDLRYSADDTNLTKPVDRDTFVKVVAEENNTENFFPKGINSKLIKSIGKSGFTKPRLYRGMDAYEFDSILENGYIKSNNSYNFGNQQGQTLFDEDVSYATSYATGFAPREIAARHYEGDMLPTYVIEVANTPNLNFRKNNVQESYTYEKVPAENITRVFEIRWDEKSEQDMFQDVTDDMKGMLPQIGTAKEKNFYGTPHFYKDSTTGTILYAMQDEAGNENGLFLSEKDSSFVIDYERMNAEGTMDIVSKITGISGNIADLVPVDLSEDENIRYSAEDTMPEEEVQRRKTVKSRANAMGLQKLRERVASLDGQIAGYERTEDRSEDMERELEQLRTDREIYQAALTKKEAKSEQAKADRQKAKDTAENAVNALTVRQTTAKSRAELKKQLYDIFSIQSGLTDIGNTIDAFAEEWISRGKIGYKQVDKLEDILMENGEIINQAIDDTAREMRSYMERGYIYVNDDTIKEFGDDWAAFRKRAFGSKIYLTRDSSHTSVDQWTLALASAFGVGRFDDTVDLKTQLENIVDLAEDGKAENLNIYEMARFYGKTQGKDAEYAYLDEMHEKLMQALKSFAQSAKIEMETVKQSMYQQVRREAERKEKAERIRQEREHREFQQKTLKQLQWLKRNQNFMGNDFQEEAKRILGNIDTIAISAANEMNWSEKHQATWQDIAKMYKWAEKNDPNFLPSKELENIVMRVEGKHLDELTASDLEDIYKAAVALRTAYYNRNNVIGDELHRQFAEVFEDSVADMETAPKPKKKTGKGRNYIDSQLNPIHRIERMFGWKENSPGFQIFGRGLEKGERLTKRYVEQANQMLDDWLTENEEWVRSSDGQGKDATWYELEVPELLEFRMGDKPIFGKTVKVYMTPMQKIYLYLESKNYDNLRHIAGGRTFVDKELYSNGEYSEAFAQGTTVSLAPETVRKIVSDLTPTEMELANLLDKYFNVFAKTEINRVSNILYGYDRAMNDNYAPIFTNHNYNRSEPGIYQDGTAEGVGHMKTRAQGAKNPTYNISALQAFQKHVSQTSRFVGMAIPAQNAKTLLNWSADGVTMQDHITHNWSQKELDSLTNVMTELQAPTYMEQSEFAGFLGKLMSNYIGGIFGANITVAAKVLASKPTAAIVLGNDNYPSIAQQRTVNDEMVRKYTSELDVRIRGLGRPELAALTLDESGYQKWVQSHKATQLTLGGGLLQAADVYVARTMWAWAENKVRAEYPELDVGTQEQIDAGVSPFYKKVAEVYENAIGDTQSMYDIMHRSDIMRDTNEITRSFTIFHTDSLQAANLIRKRAGELTAAKAEGNEKKVTDAKKAFAVTTANVLLMNALVVMFDVLRDLWRKRDDEYLDDESNMTFWSVTSSMLQQLAESCAGLLIGVDAIVPALESIFTDSTYFEHQIIAIDAFNDLIKGGVDFATALNTFIGGFADVIGNDGDVWQYLNDEADFRGMLKDTAESIVHYFSGIPAKNVERLVSNLLGWVWPQMAAAYDGLWEGRGKADLANSADLTTDIKNLYDGRYDLTDEEAAELARLYAAGFKNAVLKDTPKKWTENDEEFVLSAGTAQKYNDELANYLKPLSEIIASPEYAAATDEEKAKMLERLYNYADDLAKGHVSDTHELAKYTESVWEWLDQGMTWGQIASGNTADVNKIAKYVDAGLTGAAAEEIIETLEALEPEFDSTSVTARQKFDALAYMPISEADKEKAASVIFGNSEKAYNRYLIARKHGVLTANYADFLNVLNGIDVNGGSPTQEEFKQAVAQSGLDTEVAKEIWYTYWKSSSPWG